jgi:hypothetical protein
MDAQQFAYWLQGFAELNEGRPTSEQWKVIRDHLSTVFEKVTPPVYRTILGPDLTKGATATADVHTGVHLGVLKC